MKMLLMTYIKTKKMKILLRLEYLFLLIIGLFAYAQTGISWWWFIGLFFVPDLSMLGYLVSPKIGAFTYNLFHHFGTAVICFLLGNFLGIRFLEVAGVILFSHSAFDRFFGYGLKFSDSFHHTHLGKIGKES